MTDVRIVCAHDGVKTAQALMRLLAAEQHKVAMCHGRPSLDHLPASRSASEAVILVWSRDAPSALYMLTWLQSIDPARMVELAMAQRWPKSDKRQGEVLDFSTWNGARGGPVWRALTERLRAIGKAMEPPRPPPIRAAIALGAIGAFAVAGAVFERLHAPEPSPAATAPNAAPAIQAENGSLEIEGRGGPLEAIEPDSYVEDGPMQIAPILHAAPLETPRGARLIQPVLAPPIEFREASLFERLADFASQRDANRNKAD